MLTPELEQLINYALEDGVLTDKERSVLMRKAQAAGADLDEFEMILEAKLHEVQKAAAAAAPKSNSNKHGEIRKCPNCGAQVKGGSAVCTECGYAFSNVSANSSAEKLQAKLDEFYRRQEQRADSPGFDSDTSRKHKMEIISTFPVPNTREDLLEFLTMLQASANALGPREGVDLRRYEDLSYAYWLLYTNCINKAKLSFPNDNDFQYYFQTYEKQLQKTKGIIGYVRCHQGAKILLGFLLLLILGFSCSLLMLHFR